MKNLTILLCCLVAANAYAQSISRSSIASITAATATESGIVAHHISKINLVNTNAETGNQTTAITETASAGAGSLSVYPNPAVGTVHFAFEMPENGKATVVIYNEMGQKVSDVYQDSYNRGRETHQIDLSSFSSGVYFVSLIFTSGKTQQAQVITRKIQVLN